MEKKIKIQVRDLNLYYGQNHALHGVNMDIKENSVTALIGPSGCGKSTFLKCINRMNDLVDNVRIEGSIEIDGENIYQSIQPYFAKRSAWFSSSQIRSQ